MPKMSEIAATVGMVILALLVYDKFVKPRI